MPSILNQRPSNSGENINWWKQHVETELSNISSRIKYKMASPYGLWVGTTGKVGIGTSSPTGLFEVDISGVPVFSINSGTGAITFNNAYTFPAVDGSANYILKTNGAGAVTWAVDSTTSPGGSDTHVQFNDGGSFGGDADLVWNKTTNTLTIAGTISATTINSPGNTTEVLFNDAGVIAGDPQMVWNKTTNTLTVTGYMSASVSLETQRLRNFSTADLVIANSSDTPKFYLDTAALSIGIGATPAVSTNLNINPPTGNAVMQLDSVSGSVSRIIFNNNAALVGGIVTGATGLNIYGNSNSILFNNGAGATIDSSNILNLAVGGVTPYIHGTASTTLNILDNRSQVGLGIAATGVSDYDIHILVGDQRSTVAHPSDFASVTYFSGNNPVLVFDDSNYVPTPALTNVFIGNKSGIGYMGGCNRDGTGNVNTVSWSKNGMYFDYTAVSGTSKLAFISASDKALTAVSTATTDITYWFAGGTGITVSSDGDGSCTIASTIAGTLWARTTGTPNYLSPLTAADDIGATGARITKGWFTNLEITNMPSVGGTSIASTFLKLDQTTPQTVSSGQPILSAGLAAGSASQLTVDASGNLVTSGTLTGTLATAAQGNITSLGTLTALTVDNIVLNGNDISTSSGNLTLTPVAGSAIVLDAHWSFDGTVMTALTAANTTITAYAGNNISIESCTFDGGVFTATSIGGTLTTAAQGNITSLGTLTTLDIDNININGNTITGTGNITLDAVNAAAHSITNITNSNVTYNTALQVNGVEIVGSDNVVNKSVVESSGNWDSAYTHVSNNGSDHSFINQAVTTTATPSFAQITVDNLVINLNSITSTSGAINITPVAGSAVVVDSHFSFDGTVMTALTAANTTITAYAGNNITIESVTIDGGVLAATSLGITGQYTLPTTDGTVNYVLKTNGAGVVTWGTVTAAPAGADTQVQFNDGGVMAGGANFTWNKVTNTLSATNIAGTLTTAAQGNVTSLGILTALTVDNMVLDTSTITWSTDASLSRVLANRLQVSTELVVTSALRIGTTAPLASALVFDVGTTAVGGITFGEDTNLYRSAIDTLKTDDSFIAGQLQIDNININNNTISSTSGILYITPTPGVAVVLDTVWAFDGEILSGTAAGAVTIQAKTTTNTSGAYCQVINDMASTEYMGIVSYGTTKAGTLGGIALASASRLYALGSGLLIGQSGIKPLYLLTNDTIRIGITGAGDITNYGFTSLGTGNTAIKIKKLTGTTGASEGANTTIAHGLTGTKIIGISILVEYFTGRYVPLGYTADAGYAFEYFSNDTNIVVQNHATNSENILSKPIKVLVTYEE